jgi:hypothetical protein
MGAPGRGLIILGLPATGDGDAPKLGALGRCMPGGNLRLAAAELGEDGGPPAKAPPAKPPPDCWPAKPPVGAFGAPCRDNEKAFIFACMSEFSPLARVGGGPGLLAAFVGPSGAEEGLMEGAMVAFCELNDGGLIGD